MAFTNSFLTEVELERSRSADEFFSWVHNIIATAGKEPEGKTSIRLKRGLFKPLMEELLPLALMCKGFFNCDPRVEITPLLGNQNYDATVIDRRPNPVTFRRIEVTQAHEGEHEYLRMLDLERHGHTSLFGSVSKSGTKCSGITISIESRAMSHAAILARQIRLVQEAFERKLAKQYPPDTALLVVFEDNIAIQDEEDCQAFNSLLEKNRERLRTLFNWAGVAGWSQKCFRFLE